MEKRLEDDPPKIYRSEGEEDVIEISGGGILLIKRLSHGRHASGPTLLNAKIMDGKIPCLEFNSIVAMSFIWKGEELIVRKVSKHKLMTIYLRAIMGSFDHINNP